VDALLGSQYESVELCATSEDLELSEQDIPGTGTTTLGDLVLLWRLFVSDEHYLSS